MLPDILVSTYLEYKKDTDSIASWLASTAKAAGFDVSSLSAPASQPSAGGGRLKGKARKEAKKSSKKPVAASSAKYIIRIRDFTVLAEYLVEKAVAVPLSFQSTLDRAIAARSGFSAKLEEHGSSVDPKDDVKHENFINVLKRVRVILTSLMPAPNDNDSSVRDDDNLTNRFAGLDIYEPSDAFLAAPDIERPKKPEAETVDYAAETPSSFYDAIFAIWVLINDMNHIRSTIQSIWKYFKDGGFDVAAAAIATNTAIELVRSMMEDILPLIDRHGGLKNCLEKCYAVRCLRRGYTPEDLTMSGDAKDNFNYDTYDVANETFLMPYRLIEGFLAVIEPGQVPLYRDGMFGSFDASSNHATKSGILKFRDDRALLMPFFTDLITIVLAVPAWPVHDEFLRGMKEMTRTGRVPFYMVFAAQVFLDVTYVLGPTIERGWGTRNKHTNYMANDLKRHFEYHENLKIKTWPASNEKMIKQLRESILWLAKDTIFQVHTRLLERQGVETNSANRYRLLRMSPVISGLVLYQYRFNYREAGMAVADAWGSIQYAGHLYNALQGSSLLPSRWADMDIVMTMLGPESFFAGGEKPTTLADQFKKFCLQIGVSAASMAKQRRKGAPLASKSGPRGLKVNAPVSTMFGPRFDADSAVVLTSDDVHRIIEISAFEMETDTETGFTFMGQIEDEEKLKEIKKRRHELESKSKRAKSTAEARVSLSKLTELLVNALQAETLEFSFPYLLMHRWCWRLFRAVRQSCDPLLRNILGPDYIENESQLPFLVGYMLMLACGAEGRVPNPEPFKAASEALNAMLASGAGNFIIDKNMKGLLGLEIEIAEE